MKKNHSPHTEAPVNILNTQALVLNKGWAAIQLKTVRRVLKDAIAGKVAFIDPKDWQLYTFEEWSKLPVAAGDDYIRAGRDKNGELHKIRCPGIARDYDYSKVPRHEVRMTRKNLYLRDNGLCQYCGVSLRFSEATVDHVVPKSKGGGSTWDNQVTCCLRCNSKKADSTMEAVGYKLRKRPTKPEWFTLQSRAHGPPKAGWEKFFAIL